MRKWSQLLSRPEQQDVEAHEHDPQGASPVIELTDLLLLSLLGVCGYYAVGAVKLKETAQQAVEVHCMETGVQLLDSTIFLRRLNLRRDEGGQLRFKREFQFEFTVTGGDRNRGWIRLLGKRIVSIELAPHRFH